MAQSASQQVAVVDEENRFLRWTSRAEVHAKRLPHRSVQVVIHDRRGRIVLQRRHPDKLTYPDTWDLSASGHVEACDYPDLTRPDHELDAVYDAVAEKELREELGVSAPLERLGAFGPEPNVHYEHLVFYRGVHDGPFVPQASEVAEIRAFDPPALQAFLRGSEKRTRSLEWLLAWLSRRSA